MEPIIALTFDDGLLKHVEIARLLAKLNVRATFFIITHLKMFEEKPLLTQNTELIVELVELGHEVASHSCTHPVLPLLPQDKLVSELRESKRFLEDITGKEVLGFAYPYGLYSARVVKAVMKYYKYARATDILPYDDPLNKDIKLNPLRRFVIGSSGVRTIGTVMLHLLNPRSRFEAYPTIFIHKINTTTMLLLIKLLKMLGVKFITLSELVNKCCTDE
ncbi:MAG: polysaccharide deacetylase family protein [Infirmifilum sp.]